MTWEEATEACRCLRARCLCLETWPFERSDGEWVTVASSRLGGAEEWYRILDDDHDLLDELLRAEREYFSSLPY